MIRGKMPEIYCAVSIEFNEKADISAFLEFLVKNNIHDTNVVHPKVYKSTLVNFAIVKNEPFWDLDEALTKMFSHINHCMQELKEMVYALNGKIYIDVAFYKYETFPVLRFNGENMQKIHFLNADISIDPYSYS